MLSLPYTGLCKRDRTEAEHEAHMADDTIVSVNLRFLENLSSYDTWSCLLLIRLFSVSAVWHYNHHFLITKDGRCS